MKDLLLLIPLTVLIWVLIIHSGRPYFPKKKLVDRLKLEISRWNVLHRLYPNRGW